MSIQKKSIIVKILALPVFFFLGVAIRQVISQPVIKHSQMIEENAATLIQPLGVPPYLTPFKSLGFDASTLDTPFIYVPPEPIAPSTYDQQLGFMYVDKQTSYTVHALGCDRSVVHLMFPEETKFYIINAVHTWFWGDGTSHQGSEGTHTYAREGIYSIVLHIDISFRGGSYCRIISERTILITPPVSAPILTFSPHAALIGNNQTPPQTVTWTVANTGGRTAVIRPFMKVVSGPITDLSWITVEPREAYVLNNGLPVQFSTIINWTNAPTEMSISELTIAYEHDVISVGWQMKYAYALVIPGSIAMP